MLDRSKCLDRERCAAVKRRPERIHDAPEQSIANRHARHLGCAVDHAPGGNSGGFAEQHAADRLFSEIDRETTDPSIEDEELVEPRLG